MVDLLELSSNQSQALTYIRLDPGKNLKLVFVFVKNVTQNGSLSVVSVDRYPLHTHSSPHK